MCKLLHSFISYITMLFKIDILKQIGEGTVTTAYRRWAKPAVKAGNTLMTSVGVLKITSVEEIDYTTITDKDIQKAGLKNRAQLDKELSFKKDGTLYKILFRLQGEDPRLALREETDITVEEFEQLKTKLEKMDKTSKYGPWTETILKLIAKHPGKHAIFFAEKLGMEKDWLKLHIRKLKNLGLTISLSVGYEIAPRGEKFMQMLAKETR